MSDGINFFMIKDFINQLDNDTRTSDDIESYEVNLFKKLGFNDNDIKNVQMALERLGVNNEEERAELFEHQIKDVLSDLLKNAKDLSSVRRIILNELSSVIDLESFIRVLQIDAAQLTYSENATEVRLENLLSKFLKYEPISDENYEEMLDLLSQLEPPIQPEQSTVKNNGTTYSTIKFCYKDKNYEFVRAGETVVEKEPSNSDGDGLQVDSQDKGAENKTTTIQSIIEDFVSGSLSWREFLSQLGKEGVNTTTSSTAKVWEFAQDSDDKNYDFKFSHEGTVYHVKLSNTNLQNLLGGTANDILKFTPSDIAEAGLSDVIDTYFQVSAEKTKDGKTDVIAYTLKDGINVPGVTSSSSAKEVLEAIKTFVQSGGTVPEIKQNDDLNNKIIKIIKDFVSGSLSWGDFLSQLRNEGVNTTTDSKEGVWEINTNKEKWDFSFIHNGETYQVNIKGSDDAKKVGGEKNDIKSYSEAELINAGLTKDMIEKFFYSSLSVSKDENTTGVLYILDTDRLPTEIVSKIKGKSLSEIVPILKEYKFPAEKFADEVIEKNPIEGYKTGAKVTDSTGGFRTAFTKLIANVDSYLEKTYGSKFTSIQKSVLDEVVNKYKGKKETTVKEAVDDYLQLVYNKMNGIVNPSDIYKKPEVNADEQKFIDDLKPSEILGELYSNGKFDDIGDVTDEIEAEIKKLESKLKEKFKTELGSKFEASGYEKFDTVFSKVLSNILTKYENTSTALNAQDVINDFLKQMYAELKAQLDRKAVQDKEDSDEKTRDIKDKIKPENYKTEYNDMSKDKVKAKVAEVLNDSTLKSKFESYYSNINKTAFDKLYEAAIDECTAYYEAEAGKNNDKVTIKESDLINKFIEFLYSKIKDSDDDLRAEIYQRAGLENIAEYDDIKMTVDAGQIENKVRKLLDNDALKSNLHSYANGLQTAEYSDKAWDNIYNEVADECVEHFKGSGGAKKFSNKDVYDYFLEQMSKKLKSTDPANTLKDIDFENDINGYKSNAEIKTEKCSTEEEAKKGVITQLIKKLNTIKSELKEYIETKLGITLTDEQYERIIGDVIQGDVSVTKNIQTVTKEVLSYSASVKTKDIVDKLIQKLPKYLDDHNPKTQVFKKSDLSDFTDAEIKNTDYFEKDSDGNYKFSSKLDTVFKDYIEKNGQILSLEELRKAINDLNKLTGSDSYKDLASLISKDKIDLIDNIVGTSRKIHTEFGISTTGNIVFEQQDTTDMYKKLVQTIKTKLQEEAPSALKHLTDTELDMLIQSAWIMTYNKHNSSESNNTYDFVSDVLDNIASIFNKIAEKPEYLSVYTSHTAYANSALTSNLIYYGTMETDGNDDIWEYSGSCKVGNDGSVEWEDAADADEYKREMNRLLGNIQKTEPYKNIDSAIITKIFRTAQQKALDTCQTQKADCPYGTTGDVDLYSGIIPHSKEHDVYATPNEDWEGVSRERDRERITVRALVELTLYYFDKLLYEELAK